MSRAEWLALALVFAPLYVKFLVDAFKMFAERKNGNGNGQYAKLEASIVAVQSALALQQKDTLARANAIKEDTERIRSYCHDIINTQAGVKGATELLINRLEHWDKRR